MGDSSILNLNLHSRYSLYGLGGSIISFLFSNVFYCKDSNGYKSYGLVSKTLFVYIKVLKC